jgi:S-adenosylmethionine-diacylglycerol 3-amino-3-carboxypropyl transferase
MANKPNILSQEWQQIIDNSNQNSTYTWRTLSPNSNFVDNTSIIYQGNQTKLNQLITYQQDLANQLHQRDRVHTYVSFFIAHFNH